MQGRTKLEQKLMDEASEFLEELAAETGVSRDYLEQARPAINILFTEVPKENRSLCIETIRSLAEDQAETEANIRSARIGAEMLQENQEKMMRRMATVSKQAKQLATACAGLKLSLYTTSNQSKVLN